MSKLIVEMEMPRNCQECPLCHAMYLYGSKYCGANGIACEKEHYKLKRPDRCPIIGELPEQHGDLIDRDKLLKDIEMYHVSDGLFQHWVELQDAVLR